MSENIIIKHGTVTGNLFDLTYYGAQGFQESSTWQGGLGLTRKSGRGTTGVLLKAKESKTK